MCLILASYRCMISFDLFPCLLLISYSHIIWTVTFLSLVQNFFLFPYTLYSYSKFCLLFCLLFANNNNFVWWTHTFHIKKYSAMHPSYINNHLKVRYLLRIFDSSTNWELFEKYLCNQGSHYKLMVPCAPFNDAVSFNYHLKSEVSIVFPCQLGSTHYK